jgi:chromatin modification-related protein VID21
MDEDEPMNENEDTIVLELSTAHHVDATTELPDVSPVQSRYTTPHQHADGDAHTEPRAASPLLSQDVSTKGENARSQSVATLSEVSGSPAPASPPLSASAEGTPLEPAASTPALQKVSVSPEPAKREHSAVPPAVLALPVVSIPPSVPTPSAPIFTPAVVTALPPEAFMLEPRKPMAIIIPAPLTPLTERSQFTFPEEVVEKAPRSRHAYQPEFSIDREYPLPPLKSLPIEFQRRGKLSKLQRKREKEKERGEKSVEGKKEDWLPTGLSRWNATLRANPVWTRIARAQKTVSTRDWSVGYYLLKCAPIFTRARLLSPSCATSAPSSE